MPRRLSCSVPCLASIATCLLALLTFNVLQSPNSRLAAISPSRSHSPTHAGRRGLLFVRPGHELEGTPLRADTTAIILNWSRFHNVRKIAAELCSTELANVFRKVLVWNNSPRELHYDDFGSDHGCSPSQLRIVNSPENLYFYARYLACAEADTTYCFIQDDDYLVLPEVIQSLHHRIHEAPLPRSIYLLPPHERLSSDLRYVCDDIGLMHTGFSWLGHGAILHRSLISDFPSLTRDLGLSEDEIKMADNYFSVLNNRRAETWFDQGIPLDGGQPFTVGAEGDERNRQHIVSRALFCFFFLFSLALRSSKMRATQYLDGILADRRRGLLPFVDTTPDTTCGLFQPRRSSHAACYGRPCVLETTVSLLPTRIQHNRSSAQQMIRLEEENRNLLGPAGVSFYQSHPPSNAVDGQPATVFKSIQDGRSGDSITLDMLTVIGQSWSYVEMAWLIDASSARLLEQCIHEISHDGTTWTATTHALECTEIGGSEDRQECAVAFDTPAHGRYFRARLIGDVEESWAIYEVWLRGRKKSGI